MTDEQATTISGSKVWDNRGVKVGKIADIVVDEQTMKPRWAVVSFGLMNRQTLVPTDCLYRAQDGSVTAMVDRDVIRHAPRVEGDPHTVADKADRYYRTA